MKTQGCGRIAIPDLTDYAAGELAAAEAAAVEEHLFSCAECAARAAEFDALMRLLGPAVRSAKFGGFVTDAVLNRMARDGVRVRTFTLSPGAIVPCAVWDDDEVMVLRMRGDFAAAGEVTLSQRVAGAELVRATAPVAGGSPGELIYVTPAAWIRDLPVVDVDVVLTAREGDEDRPLGSYTLQHGGVLSRHT